jgi:2-haloacid dehalogenase
MAEGVRRVVIFDMGNVLIDWNPDKIYAAHIPEAQERALFFAGLFRRMHWAVHNSDHSFSDALLELKRTEPDAKALIEQFEHSWHAFVHGPLHESVAVLKELSVAKVPLYGLTNWPHQTWPPRPSEENPAEYGFLEHFEDIVVSGQVKMHKPDENIYDYALSRFGVGAKDAVFVDDLAENVETANRLGLHGIQFTDAASLRRELTDLGLLETYG